MNRHIVLFLDIDGVLLPFPTKPLFQFPDGRIFPNETLSALSLILEAFPKDKCNCCNVDTSMVDNPASHVCNCTAVNIVLSSTWRVQKSIRNDIIADFHAYGIGPLSTFDADFYDITDPKLHTERQHEIYAWLQQYCETNTYTDLAWIALDDEELLHGSTNAARKSTFDGHVIHCDSKCGLTHKQAAEAIKLLRQQLDVPPKDSK
jgi:HAD domain in Swiss Army Knife RNA repair proteins